MRYLFLIVLICQYVNSCKNFLVQQCTDIPIGFNSITSIKCIQLIPSQFDSSIDYSVENYIIKKALKCYDILSYNSSLINLFSNQCQELCPEQYCLLFDNQPKTSIINIFYSQSSIYDLNNALSNNFSSYDYYLFDSCSSSYEQSRTLLIVVYVLCGIVGVLTIKIDPYNWRWIIDFLLCQIRPTTEQSNRSPRLEEYESQTRVDGNRSQPRHDHVCSVQSNTTPTASSDNAYERSSNSTDPRYRNYSSENSTPNLLRGTNLEYYYGEFDETVDPPQRSSISQTLQKLSAKASNTLSIKSNTYDVLEARLSPEFIITRF
jgi:hypothetical protein